MDPPLPLNPSPRPGAKHPQPPPSPKNPSKPTQSQDSKQHSGGGDGGGVEVSIEVMTIPPPDNEDSHNGCTDATTAPKDPDEDEDLHLEIKGTMKIQLKDVNLKINSSGKKEGHPSIQDYLKENPEQLTLTNLFDMSSIENAVQSGNSNQLDEFISTDHVSIHAILYAIRENNVPMVKHLLKSFPKGKGTWAKKQTREASRFEDAEFPAYITPIILAAKLDRQEIIQLLIQTDNCEIHPLTVPCTFGDDCEMCTAFPSLEARRKVEESMRLLEIYRALASPAFIFHSTDDPVLEAFKISKKMDHLQKEDPAFKEEYHLINIQAQKFACELLDLCRSSREINSMLAEKEGKEVNARGHMAKYPRIRLALYYEQKEFIAHTHCQDTIRQVWHEGLTDWVYRFLRLKGASLVYFILWLFAWPFLCIGFMLRVSPKLIDFVKSPMNRFISDTVSFFLFILFLIANVLISDNTTDTQGQWFYPVEYLIILWVFSMTCRIMRMSVAHCYTQCSSRVSYRKRRWFDALMLLAFWIWIILRIIIIIISYVKDERHVPRSMWSGYNVFLFSDAFYAIGVILSFVRLNSLFKASRSLGPMQISLKKMVSDIIRFLCIFFIVMTAFVVAVTKIYASYEGSTRLDAEGNVVKEQKDEFISFPKTYKNLFWSLFGYPDMLYGGQIVVDNAALNSTDPEVIRHRFTEFFGLTLIALYHCIAVIVMLNMLIAMMANSYNTIECNADTEWKFARTQLRMMYCNDVGSLPPPFNVTVVSLIIKGICELCCKECQRQPPLDVDKCNYNLLILRLYKRYWNQRQNKCLKQEEEIHFLIEQLKSNAVSSLSIADLSKLNSQQTSA